MAPERRTIGAGTFALLTVIAGQASTAARPEENGNTRIANAVRISGDIIIDGSLDESDWRRAHPLTVFTQRFPAEGEAATQPSEVRILYDDDRLLVGALLLDSEPERIIARELKEDGDLTSDDTFAVLLDTFHDKRNGFYFLTNPHGARADALIYDEGRTRSFDWDGVWDVAGRITARGWVVEMEIPFKTLNFDPANTQVWGLQVWRGIRRNAEDASWAPVPRSEDVLRVSRAGELRGLEGIRQGSRLQIVPYALGELSERPSLDEEDVEGDGEIGIDARYALTPNLVGVVTINTDFAETEVDTQQVNITRFPLFFPEKRDFFLESTGYFEFGFNRTGPGALPEVIPFFSRRIGFSEETERPVPIMGGVKLAGRIDRYNLGFLSINTDEEIGSPQTNYTVLRLSRDILSRSNWGIIGVSKEPAGPDDPTDPADPLAGNHSNRTYGADLNFSVLENFKFGGSLQQSDTPGAPGSQRAGNAYANWSNNSWEMEISHRDIDELFNPEVGFVQRTGIEDTSGFLGWSWRSKDAMIRRIDPHARFSYIADQSHDLATRRQHWAGTVEFRDSSEIEIAWNPSFDELLEDFVLDEEDEVFVRPGAYSMDQYLVRWRGDRSTVVSGSVFAEWGDFFDGDIRSANAGVQARFSKYVRVGVDARRTEIDLPRRPAIPGDPNSMEIPAKDFHFSLVQARVGLSFTTEMSLDTFVQYNTDEDDISTNIRFNYKYRPGSDIYVVYNERRDIEGEPGDVADRTFTVKWTYLMAF